MFATVARRRLTTTLTLLIALGTSPAVAREKSSAVSPQPLPQIVRHDPSVVIHGGRPAGLAKAVADSFNLYGGVRVDGTNDRRPEGQFQDFILFPEEQGWVGVDRTENPTFWNISTFNANNLDLGQVDNRAMWSGVPAGTSGYLTAPGYGNNWNDVLLWNADAFNPTANTNVRLQFVFNHDTEPGFDYFYAEYDSAGSWIPWAQIDGTNKDEFNQFVTPVNFDESVVFNPLMYVGTPRNDVRLRLRVVSDGAWSDEDGLWPTRGAVQVDNIRVTFNGAPATPVIGGDGVATFEDLGGSDDTEGWAPISAAYAGDFAKVLPRLTAFDPCRQNLSPVLAFIDDGTIPSNATQSTGGSLSPTWDYGVRGGWVVNYTGGISQGLVPLNNEYWSPEIAWNDPNSTEDDGLEGGAFMRFTVWQHLPLDNGLFWTWSVRSQKDESWSPWLNRGFVYYGDGGGAYLNAQIDVTDRLTPDPDLVQVALGVADLAEVFELQGLDATPSPTFDNFSFWRYDLGGPVFSTRNIDLFQDGFPNNGGLDLNDPASLSVRVDMARDISTGLSIIPGDSIVVDVSATVPGSALAGAPVMKWILDANPAFDGVRSLPVGAVDEGPGVRGWTRWTGTVVGDSSRTSSGVAVANRWFFDMPNDGPANALASYQTNEPAMFFPGDRIRYFIEATDTEANTSTLPADTTGFYGTGGYSRTFTVRALPSVDFDGVNPPTQPEILVLNDFGRRGGENDWLTAFAQLGLQEDVDYEVFTTMGPSSLVSNGIGSAGAHGATGGQLAGYPVILYLSGDLSDGLISDGTNINGNDKGNDVETLTQWHDLPGDRYIAYWGDNLSSFLGTSGAGGAAYLNTLMGVNSVDVDVRDEIDGQAAPRVRPVPATGIGFTTEFIAYGGCLGINQFDSIQPMGGAIAGHEFVQPLTGLPLTPAASVWFDRQQQVDVDSYRRVALTFPYDFAFVYTPIETSNPGGIFSRTLLLQEVLQAFGQSTNPGNATDTGPTPRRFEVFDAVPNPFNPATKIRFAAPAAGRIAVRIYNVRGELVKTLLDGEVAAGEHALVWDGTDGRGATVSSGVYLYEVTGFGQREARKMALLK